MKNIEKAYKQMITESADIDVSNEPEVLEAKKAALGRLASENRENWMTRLPTSDWKATRNTNGNHEKISKEEYEDLKNKITSTAKYEVHYAHGTSASSWVTGNHHQMFLSSPHNSLEQFYPNTSHPDQSLPIVLKFTDKHTGEEHHYKVDKK